MALIFWGSLAMLAVLSPTWAGSLGEVSCTEEGLSIVGGEYNLTNGLEVGSVLVYRCPPGYYPSPATRHCLRTGRWSPALDSKHPAECKVVTCPDPLVFENGEVSPMQSIYYHTNVTTYKCYNGFKQRGSTVRVCQVNGKWNGSTPICDSATGNCSDPGIPPGARRTGHHFETGKKVTYRCDQGLTLLGSEERVCQKNGEWSGLAPACYSKFTYDLPEEGAASLAASLRDTLKGDDEGWHGRQIRLNQASRFHIYIALDFSDSIKKRDFMSMQYAKKIVEWTKYLSITPRYEILVFATETTEIVNIADPDYQNLDIINLLDDFKYDGGSGMSGTNIAGAFEFINGKMSFMESLDKDGYKDVQNVIMMFTDGVANMGGSAEPKVKKIKSFLNIANNRDKFLDIYMFAIGQEANLEEIDKLVTKRAPESHLFVMQNKESMIEMLDKMLDDSM